MFKQALFLLFTLFISISTVSAQSKKAAKPNIIYILMDDLGYGDLGIFMQNERKTKGDKSEPWFFTPHIDRMARAGAIMPNHYAAAPVCAPSRASILTGLNQGHANVRDNQFDKALEDNYNVANMLKAAGYATSAVGKWGLQGKAKAPNWPAHPLKRGFDYYYGYIAHGDGHEHYPKEGLYRNPKPVYENYDEVSQQLDKCYTADLFTAVAKKYIVNQVRQKTDEPFFMYLAYDTPHAVTELPTQAYPSGSGLTGGIQWLGKPGQMINTASGTPDSYYYPQYQNATYDHDKDPKTAEIAWPEVYKRYASVLARMDENIGDIVQLLKDLKIDQNTMIVFSSDNGPSKESYLPKRNYEPDFFNSFGPFDGIKRDLLEGGLRTPTIAYWPGKIPANTNVKTPSISYDWLATFAEAAGVAAPVRSNGVSQIASLTGKGKQVPAVVYSEYFNKDQTPAYPEFLPKHQKKARNQMQMLRSGDTVAVRYDIESASDKFQIFNINLDPQQGNDLAANKPALQKRFQDLALQMRMPDTAAARPYDEAFVPAVNLVAPKGGLILSQFSNPYQWIPETASLKVLSKSGVKNLNATGAAGANLYLFEGYIKVPKDAEYTFTISSAGKSFLKIHGASVIDNDYEQSKSKQGVIRLKAGYHPIKIYSTKAAGSGLKLDWSTDGAESRSVGSEVFFN